MPDNLVFHESFDSTRTADSNTSPNVAQAQAEALISLLLDHSISISNTYAFDSRGVLELMRALLSARDDIGKSLDPHSQARGRLVRAEPVLITFYGASSFVEACVAQLRKCDPGDPENRFLLSAWGSIDLRPDLRTELADALLRGPRPAPPPWFKEYPELVEHLDALQMTMEYASAYNRGVPADSRPGTQVIDYLEYFHRLGTEHQHMARFAEDYKCPADIAMAMWERVNDELSADGGRDKLSSRSWIHVEVSKTDRDDPSLPLLEQLKELVDTFYNARLAESAYAEHNFLSSVPRSSDIDELKYVNSLAAGVIRNLQPGAMVPPMAGVFTAADNAPELAPPALRRLFRAYWEIIADEERHRVWRQSCAKVNDQLRVRPQPGAASFGDWAQRFGESWADHLSLLTRQLPEVVRTEGGALRVAVGMDNSRYECVQFARPSADAEAEVLTSEEVDTALATSRYISNLARWVNR
jgi:hypothetical protein